MIKCDYCDLDARFKAEKRFNLFRIQPKYLCDVHRRRFERHEDWLLLGGLLLAILLGVGGFYGSFTMRENQVREETVRQQEYSVKDLDHDGRVTWFEEQVTPAQMQNFNLTGYPFFKILYPPTPTKPVKKRLDVAGFLAAAQPETTQGTTLLKAFVHPILMRNFLVDHTSGKAAQQIRAIYLTHDEFLAFALAKPGSESIEMICLEKLSPEQETEILAGVTEVEKGK